MNFKSLIILPVLISISMNVDASSTWYGLQPSLFAGYGYTRVGDAQNLWLNTTPDPGLENTYTSGGQQRGTFLLGFALDKTISNLKGIESALGLELDYLRNPNISGVVEPMVNVAPDFDTLNYSYDMTSYLVQATAKLTKTNIINNLGVYLQAGLGGTLNRFSDYTETSPTGSSAAPMLSPFGNESTLQLAFSLGAGFSYQVGNSARYSVGYRYINTGMGGLDTSPVQQTSHTLNFSPLNHHFIIFSLAT